jgi:hypothetical protein
VCKPIWADLPTAAIKNKQPATVIIQKLSLLKNMVLVNIVEKLTLPTQNNTNPPAAIKLISPTRLTIIAFNAALFACNRVYQKLINKYEHKPTPSQPTNKMTKLLPDTKININMVNNDK